MRAMVGTPLAANTVQNTVPIGGALGIASATPKTVVSMALPAGVYIIWGNLNVATSLLTASEWRLGMNTVTNVLPTQAGGGGVGPDPLTIIPLALSLATGSITSSCGPTILTLAVPTTLFLVCQVTFTLGTASAYGTLSAVRIDLP